MTEVETETQYRQTVAAPLEGAAAQSRGSRMEGDVPAPACQIGQPGEPEIDYPDGDSPDVHSGGVREVVDGAHPQTQAGEPFPRLTGVRARVATRCTRRSDIE